MKTTYFLVLLFLAATTVFAQEHLELKSLGFAMDAPKGWFKSQDGEVIKNIDNDKFSKDQMEAFLKSLNGASKFVGFYKYDPQVVQGFSPTINVALRPAKVKSFDDFKFYILHSSEKIKEVMKTYTATEPEIMNVDNTKVWVLTATYDIDLNEKEHIKMHNKIVYIYRGEYYISLFFVEQVNKEDNSVLFNEVIKSIKLTAVPLRE
ncbi:hypothetical protein Q765_11500 [Flavobacterium rivuli WB 3.3-2 = DSM 21788]|uniref:PsbP C-terminal domain-containing protein n=1 Tax=Flavobacterium rivuli WB 3.3-2 = DSM 21788 TaxID=1121895 RepID=A0A0A2M4U8_9FLAO|nr:hypothetical protein [Flavobacterium rivuli]KGO86488.1 hypothetical protein Q765_11500 [Flavobacterium rivuli WB 3.3-2 = DSM 21788]